MRATVLTHRRGRDTGEVLARLVAIAGRHDVTLRFDAEETRKHALRPGDGLELDVDGDGDVDICLVLGGDGTILSALRRYAGTSIPVFAVNFGEIGFLATMDPEDVEEGIERAFTGEYDVMALPSISAARPSGRWVGFNDISVHRRPGDRVADLSYALGGEEIGRVRCDGLVVCTPAGSTGYNLANGGPVLAWGVEGFAVSFIAPHSMSARALVIAPGDVLTVHNRSREDRVEVHVDGRPVSDIPAHEEIAVEFATTEALLAQMPGASFYHRLRERFGRLAR